MTGTRRPWLDAESGDVVFESGAPKNDPTSMSNVVLALKTRRGTCPLLPRFGSRLHKIRTARTNSVVRAEAYVQEALKHLIERGEVRGLKVTAAAAGNKLSIVVAYRDRANQQRTVQYSP